MMRWPKWFWDLRSAWRVTAERRGDVFSPGKASDEMRRVVAEEFEISRPLLDAFAAEELPEPLILDPLLGRFVAEEPAPARDLSPEEEARIRKIVSDSLWAEREGQSFPRCEDHLDGMDGAAVFFCDRSSGHGGFHRDRENKVTWVSDSGGK